MDHSYSTERERLQRSDHSYFTVGKKTPQVVLRKAQHLREHSLEIVKSSVGQDHSYVRSRRAAQRITTRFNGLDVLIKAINYRQSHADILNDEQQLGEMEIPDCEQPMLSQHHACLSESGAPVSAADNVTSVETGQTTSANDSASVTFRHTDLDNLPCWIGCIQLDHPYNSHTSSASNNCPSFAQPELAGVQNATEPTSVDVSCDRDINQHSPVNAKNCWDGLSDHAYESSSRDAQSLGDRSWWDHAYNIQCSTDHPSSTVSRCASVQHLDHSYDTRMSSELSYSETFLSSILDHAYFASEWTAGWRQTSGQRWSSSDDVRTASRPVPAFVS